jgi:hypothetical protein
MFFINRNFDWTKSNILEENHQLFVLRWYEIFNENTFDSWQVRTSNAISILNEILESTFIIEQLHEYHVNIEKLINELKKVIENDIIIKKYYSYLGEYINTIKKTYDENVKNENKKNLPYFRNIIQVVIIKLQDYKKNLYEELELVLKSDKLMKNDIYHLTLHLGTLLQNDGYSMAELRSSIDIFQDNPEKNFFEKYTTFKNKYIGTCEQYECHFIIKWLKSSGALPIFKSHKISFYDNMTSVMSDIEQSFYDRYPNEVFARVDVESCDYYSAREKAEMLLENIFSLKKLFQKEKEVAVKINDCLIKKGDQVKIIGKETFRKYYIKDSKKSDEHVVSFADTLLSINDNDSKRIISSLEYHKLGILSSSNEARLVNLWIALETLIPEEKSSIISRICSYVPPSIATEYINQMLRETCKFIKPYLRIPEKRNKLKELGIKSEYYITPKDLLDILLDIKDGPKITKFFEVIGDNTLLVFRIFRIWMRFDEIKELLKMIERHHENIEMQLNRIYRARNSITHHGRYSYQISQLIQHLHTYYITFMHNLRHDLMENHKTINDALVYRKMLYQYIGIELRNYKSKPFDVKKLISVDKFFKGMKEKSDFIVDKWIC